MQSQKGQEDRGAVQANDRSVSSATTKEFADYRREKFHCDDHVYRLVFYFEVLETSDEEKLKQGAERLFYFRDPEYMTQRDNRIFWRDYPFGHC